MDDKRGRLFASEKDQASESERMETDRVESQERRCKQVAAEIDEYRLEMERGDKGGSEEREGTRS